MSKRDEFITVVNTFKAASQTINKEQRIGLLRQAVQQYGLSADDADKILEASGLIVGERKNYFQILGLSVEELQDQSETDIAKHVDAAYNEHYQASLRAGARVRADGNTEDQWRDLLNEARDILKDTEKRHEHITALQQDKDDIPFTGDTLPIFKFSNGEEATSIPQLANLMAKHSQEATNGLYRGYLEQSLGRVGEMHFATAARTAVKDFHNNPELGLKAMVQVLRGKMAFQHGGEVQTLRQRDQQMEAQAHNEARTPKQIAHLIDRNWEEAKNLLYHGFMTFWFTYTKQPKLANIAKTITERYSGERDMGLEMLVQELDPQIGQPELVISQARIDFGTLDTETQKTIQIEIRNVGRGFLYGEVQLARKMPGLSLSAPPIREETAVTFDLDASYLTVKRSHETELLINTNGGRLQVPISCYVAYPIQKSIYRMLISGVAVAGITLVPCLIILLFEYSGWLAPRLTQGGFISWEEYLSWVWGEKDEWGPLPIYILSRPWKGLSFVLAAISLGLGIFAYRYFFFKRKKGYPKRFRSPVIRGKRPKRVRGSAQQPQRKRASIKRSRSHKRANSLKLKDRGER